MTRVTRPPVPPSQAAGVLAVLVCHNGEQWLRLALSALRRSTGTPRHILAVDTGSTDGTARILAQAAGAEKLLDGVLTLPTETGFGSAVTAAVEHAVQRWGDPGSWVWLLHDDCAPEPACLDTLLATAEVAHSVGIVGPLLVDWNDPRLITGAGLSMDVAGNRHSGGVPELSETVKGSAEETVVLRRTTEELAVSSAGMLIRRSLWQRLSGFDPGLPLFFDDIDLGWRANQSGSVVLCVPDARMRHVAAASTRQRDTPALPCAPHRARRAYGLRTYLVNCSGPAFLLGMPRLVLL
ncbi:MAG: glycosyltransferase family 2 protein, partial [Sciscionella sp.]